jgi:hypothetical protein
MIKVKNHYLVLSNRHGNIPVIHQQSMLYVVSVVTMVMQSQRQHMSSMVEMELLAMVQVMVSLLFE